LAVRSPSLGDVLTVNPEACLGGVLAVNPEASEQAAHTTGNGAFTERNTLW
jgi:hypothetical protein